MTEFLREERLLIDGELVPAADVRSYENINPARLRSRPPPRYSERC